MPARRAKDHPPQRRPTIPTSFFSPGIFCQRNLATLFNNPAPAHPFRISQKYGPNLPSLPGARLRTGGRAQREPGMTKQHSSRGRLLALTVREVAHDDIEDRREAPAEQ